MDARELKLMLRSRLEDLCQYLLPHGERKGAYWHAGSAKGEAGDSLRVCLTGAKRGVWRDFSSNEKGGDELDLWMAHFDLTKLKDALPGVREWLGVKEIPRVSRIKKEYETPDTDYKKIPSVSQLMEYLHEERKLPKAQIRENIACKGDGTYAFPYFDDEGELRMVKYIALKRNERGKKKTWFSSNSMPILYGMDSVLLSKGGRLVITEGEIDKESFEAQGIGAVSVPFGAKGEDKSGHSPNDEWIDNCWKWLEQFDTIYVAMDNDEEGQTAALAIIKRLGAERCMLVNYGKHKDANEVLQAGGQLTDCLASAKPIEPSMLVVASDLADEVWESIQLGPRERQGHLLFDWEFRSGLQFRVRPREGTIITGFAGHGKSNFLYQTATWLACVKHEGVFIGSYEEPAREILSIMVTQALGRKLKSDERGLFNEIKEELLQYITIHAFEGVVDYKEYFKIARYAVKRHGAKHAILDSASCTNIDLDDNEDVAKFAKEWQAFFKSTGVHSWLVCHPRKGLNEKFAPGKQDIKGSGYLGDLCFNVLSIHREEDDDESDKVSNKGYFKCDKQKVGGHKPKQLMFYSPESLRYSLKRGQGQECYIESIRLKGIPE